MRILFLFALFRTRLVHLKVFVDFVSCNKVSLRDFKRLVGIVEKIRESGVSTTTIDLISEALAIGVVASSRPDKAIDELIDFNQSMQLIAKVVQGGRVTDEERKKSE